MTAVICSRDRPMAVRSIVADLRAQVDAPAFDIIVVDDGSQPPLDLGRPAEGAAALVVRSPVSRGRSRARNTGAQTARGDLLVFLDDDVRVPPHFLAAHDAAHRRWDGALVVGPLSLPDRARETPFGRFRSRLEAQGQPHRGGPADRPNLCTAANMSMPRRLFANLGGFREGLDSGEDQDLALRHSGRGGRIIFAPEAGGIHEDQALDIRAYCKRAEWGALHTVDFCHAQPDWPENQQRIRVNGPPLPGREPAIRTVKKLAKAVLGQPPLAGLLFALVALLERTGLEGAALDTAYRTLLGIHLQRGFRKGWRTHPGPRTSTEKTP